MKIKIYIVLRKGKAKSIKLLITDACDEPCLISACTSGLIWIAHRFARPTSRMYALWLFIDPQSKWANETTHGKVLRHSALGFRSALIHSESLIESRKPSAAESHLSILQLYRICTSEFSVILHNLGLIRNIN